MTSLTFLTALETPMVLFRKYFYRRLEVKRMLTFTNVGVFVAITKLDGFMHTGGGAGGDSCTKSA